MMGLDNASPFFDFTTLLYRIFRNDNFFEFGGLFYAPGMWLAALGFSPWIASHIQYWSSFIVGITGMFLIASYFFSGKEWTDKKYKTFVNSPYLVITLFFLLGNLVTIWIYNQPIILFSSAFAGIPALIILFMHNKKARDNQYMKIYLAIGLMYFFTTSINIVAFTFFFIQASIIAAVLAYYKKEELKTVMIRTFIVGISWLVLTQVLLFFTPQKNFILSEIFNYGQIIASDAKSSTITDSLIIAESTRNSLLNVMRFATGWMQLNDAANERVFIFAHLYNEVFFFLLGLLVPGIILVSSAFVVKKYPKMKVLYGTFIITSLLMSTYLIAVYSYIPFVREMTRWISSKLWPTFLISSGILFVHSLQVLAELMPRWNRVVKAFVIVALGIYAFPWLTGQIINRYSYVKLPQEYITLENFSKDTTILYLPAPQKEYMRQYQWGYYGSDFLHYLTKASLIDNGQFAARNNKYGDYIQAVGGCEIEKLDGIDVIIIDNSLSYIYTEVPPCFDRFPTVKNKYFTTITLSK